MFSGVLLTFYANLYLISYCVAFDWGNEGITRFDSTVLQILLLKNDLRAVLTKDFLSIVDGNNAIVDTYKFDAPVKSGDELKVEKLAGASITFFESWDSLLICAQEWNRCKVVEVGKDGKIGNVKETDLQVYLSEVSAFVPVQKRPGDLQPVVFAHLFRANPNEEKITDTNYIGLSGFDPKQLSQDIVDKMFNFDSKYKASYVQRGGLNYSMLPYTAAESQYDLLDEYKIKEGTLRDLTAFNPGNGFVYFVRMMTKKDQFYEGYVGREYRKLRVLRICDDESKGPLLYSWTEMSLVCGEDEHAFMSDFETVAVTYDEKLRRLVSLSTNAEENRVGVTSRICSFGLDEIDYILDRSYENCQNKSMISDRNANCNGPPKLDWNCVWRHNSRFNKPDFCEPLLEDKFYNQMPYIDIPDLQAALPKDRQPYPICEIEYFHKHMGNYELEQVRPLRGKLISDAPIWDVSDLLETPQIGIVVHHHKQKPAKNDNDFSIITWNNRGDIFRLVEKSQNKWMILNERKSHVRVPCSAVLNDDELIFSDGNHMFRMSLTCESMYRKCESVVNSYENEPLKCVWCTEMDGTDGQILPETVCNADAEKVAFTAACPPLLKQIEYESETNVLVFNADNLQNLRSADSTESFVDVCRQNCQIMDKNADSISCSPILDGKNVIDCGYVLYGVVGNTWLNLSGNVGDLMANAVIRNNDGHNYVVTAIAILIFLIFLVIFGFCVHKLRRKYGWCNSKKAASRLLRSNTSNDSSTHFNIHLDPNNLTAGYLNPRRANSYDGNSYPAHMVQGVDYRQVLGDAMKDVPENLFLPHDKVKSLKLVGNGHYGVVYQGEYTHRDGNVEIVAIKSVLDARNVEGVSEFLREGLRMEPFDHKHVLKLTGICFNEQGLPKIVTPYMNKGDLLNFIRKEEHNGHCTLRGLIRFAAEIADGMAYLHGLKFVHRDLACRNCMLRDDLTVCIADFGLSRDVYEMQEYVPVHADRLLPIRWMALEVIYKESYTYKSDMWSYGVALWEIVTRGLIPYADMDSQQIAARLEKGERLSKPQFCPDNLYDLMYACWQRDPSVRPAAHDVFGQLTDLLNRTSIVNSDAVHSPSYYNVLPEKLNKKEDERVTAV